MMTKEAKEERAKKKAARLAASDELALKFPGARLEWTASGFGDVQIVVEEGCSRSLKVRINNLAMLEKEHWNGPHQWHNAYIPLKNIEQIAEFVGALTARLNNMIDESNSAIDSVPAKKELRTL